MFRLFARLPRWLTPGRQSDRKIFRYWDGSKFRSCDPIAAFYAMNDHEAFVAKVHGPLIDNGDPEATSIACDAIRQAFGVEAWTENGGGLTISELLELYGEFCDFLENLKKNIELTQTSPSPTEPTSIESDSETLNDSSDSLPIELDKKPDTPTG